MGKPQLVSFLPGSPAAVCYRPSAPSTGSHLHCLVSYRRLRREDILRGRSFVCNRIVNTRDRSIGLTHGRNSNVSGCRETWGSPTPSRFGLSNSDSSTTYPPIVPSENVTIRPSIQASPTFETIQVSCR